jgi:uncharacterized protein (TIGR00369 family)
VTSNLVKFRYEPDPDNPGWHLWQLRESESFAHAIGPLNVRIDEGSDGTQRLRLRMHPQRRHCNVLDTVHGGAMLTLVDLSLFAAIRLVLNGNGDGAVTLDLTSQFLSAAHAGRPVDAVVEILRETGRLVFMRGLVEQDESVVAAFSATVRKPTQR